MKTFKSFKNKEIISEKSDIFGVMRKLSPVLHSREYKAALIELKRFVLKTTASGKPLPHSIFYYAHNIGKRFGENVDARLLAQIFLKWYNEEYPSDDFKLNESLNTDDDIVTWIRDFRKSKAKQFKGKTKEERRKMAIAAYLTNKDRNEDYDNEMTDIVLNEMKNEDSIELSESDHEVIASIWNETLFHLFDTDDTDALVESILRSRDQMLFEENKAVIPKDSKIVFGKVISTKSNKMIGRIVKNKFVKLTPSDKDSDNEKKSKDDGEKKETDSSAKEADDIDASPAHIKSVFRRLKKEIKGIASDLGESKESITKALSDKTVQEAFKHTGYSIKKAGEAVHRSVALINTSLSQGFKEIEKAGGLKKLHDGSEKIDEFFDRHPFIKKMSGPLVAGALIYQWNNMSFSGHFGSDFDVTSILDAVHGKFSITDIIATPSGAKAMTQFIFGMATGKILGNAITFPWNLGMSAALVYTGAKNAKDKKVADKAWNKMQELIPKEKEKTMKEESKYYDILASNLLVEKRSVDRTIKDLLSISDIAEDLLDAINDKNTKEIERLLKKEFPSDATLRNQIISTLLKEIPK